MSVPLSFSREQTPVVEVDKKRKARGGTYTLLKLANFPLQKPVEGLYVVEVTEPDQPDKEYGTGEVLEGFGTCYFRLPPGFDIESITDYDTNKYGSVSLSLAGGGCIDVCPSGTSQWKWSEINVKWGLGSEFGITWKEAQEIAEKEEAEEEEEEEEVGDEDKDA